MQIVEQFSMVEKPVVQDIIVGLVLVILAELVDDQGANMPTELGTTVDEFGRTEEGNGLPGDDRGPDQGPGEGFESF